MPLPKSIKSAANCLIVTGLFYLAIITSMHMMYSKEGSGMPFIGVVWTVAGLLLWLSAYLLYQGKKEGLLVWWICSPFVLFTFPIGTILGLIILKYVLSEDTKNFFSSNQNPALKPIVLDER